MKLNFIAATTALILSLASSSAQEATPANAGSLRRKLVSANVQGPECLRISGVPGLEGEYMFQDETISRSVTGTPRVVLPAVYKRQDGADIVIFSYVSNRGSQIYTASSEADFRRAERRTRFRASREFGFCSGNADITDCTGEWAIRRNTFTGSVFEPCE